MDLSISSSNSSDIKNLYSKIIKRIIPYIFVCYLFNYLDRVNVGFAKLQMLEDLNMSEAAYGLGAGIFFIGYLLFGLPSNIALQKFGARIWIAVIMILWGALSASLMFVKTEESFYIIRFFTGATEAGFFPGLVLYFTRWFPTAVRGRVMALFMSAIPLSGVIGGPLSGWILDAFTSKPLAGLAAWQWLFIIEGIPTILLGIGIYYILDDKIEDAKWLTKEEKETLLANLAADEKNKSRVKSETIAEVMKSGIVWTLGLIYFSFQGGVYAISFWLPSVIKAGGWGSMFMVGIVTAIPYTAATIFMLYMGKSADARNERRWHLAVPMLMSAFGLMIAAMFSHSPLIALTGLTVATMGAFTALPMFWPLSSSYLSASAAVGGLAIINAVGQIAGFSSPYFVGWIKGLTGTTDIAWYCLSFATLLGAFIMLYISRKEKM
ncbi:MFS transporter [Morganella morganii]|uniref:MFS transporter n=1 Tax=Morganella morganii TaxID=582 RepID=UPI0033154F29